MDAFILGLYHIDQICKKLKFDRQIILLSRETEEDLLDDPGALNEIKNKCLDMQVGFIFMFVLPPLFCR